MREKSLVIMAAGLGSRFKGGVKQLQAVGEFGECIMEYSVYDAIEAGFNRIVFIIRRDIEAPFNEAVGDRLRKACADRNAEMLCVYQETDALPEGFLCPEDRVKPWGTGHAILSCKERVKGSFAVINADDFYGKEAFRLMADFLDGLPEGSEGSYALAGFLLENTLSDNGGVTRGLCSVDEGNCLTAIEETRHIVKVGGLPGVERGGELCLLDGKTPVSMNMWAFTGDVFHKLERRFVDFLRQGGLEQERSEFLVPVEIGKMVKDGEARVQVLPTGGRWFGMTFSEDLPKVQAAIKAMSDAGDYSSPLFK